MKSRLRSAMIWLSVWISCSLATAAIAQVRAPRNGIAGGNHMVSPDFDFILTIPGGWDDVSPASGLAGRAANPLPVEIWKVSNQRTVGDKDASTMQIEFFSSIDAKDLTALRTYVEAKYPNNQWADYTDARLVGLRSNETADSTDSQAKIGHLFYFMDRNMIVAIHWRRHPAGNGNRGISELLLSMDRKTAPPILRAIEFSRKDSVKPGDDLCIYFKVDDLKSSFDAASFRNLNLSGIPKNYIWQNVTWDEALGRFNVCFKVPTAIASAADLQVSKLSIENERGNSLECSIEPPSKQLRCDVWRPTVYPIDQAPPSVENSNVDRDPPVVEGMSIEQTSEHVTLKIQAHDATSILGGWVNLQQIPGERTNIFIAPWQLHSGQFEIDLTRYSTSGTRRISQVGLSDSNGFGVSYVDCALVKMPSQGEACKAGFYAKCTNDSKCEPTSMTVVEYFSAKRGPNH